MAGKARKPRRQGDESLEKSRESKRNYRSLLIEANIRGQEARDNMLLALSSGALGISFAFIDHFVTGVPHVPMLLFIAWGCWAISVVLQLCNYRLSEKAFDWQIAQTDKQLADGSVNDDAVNFWDSYVDRINNLVIVLFVMGVLSLGIFVYENYGASTNEKCECQKTCCVVTNNANTGAVMAPDLGGNDMAKIGNKSGGIKPSSVPVRPTRPTTIPEIRIDSGTTKIKSPEPLTEATRVPPPPPEPKGGGKG